MRVHALQGDTLDALCWRHLGTTSGVVEEALKLNPGLADHGPRIPHGTAVRLPAPPAAGASGRPLVQLWD